MPDSERLTIENVNLDDEREMDALIDQMFTAGLARVKAEGDDLRRKGLLDSEGNLVGKAFDEKGAANFREILHSLSSGIRETVDLHSDPGIEVIDTTETWRNIEGLVEPFCEATTQGFQWLTEGGDASLLLSTDGAW